MNRLPCFGAASALAPLKHLADAAVRTLYAARGRRIPLNSNSPTGSTFTAFSTFVSTRGLIEDLPRLGLIAQPRGDVGHRADGGIVEACPQSRWCRA